jgi:mercuric ion binding protein
MNTSLLSWLLAPVLALTASIASAETIKAQVNGMVCAFCAQGIEKKLRALPQTKNVYVNLKHKIVAVELQDGQTVPLDTIRELVKDAGYEVTHIESVGQTVEEIKATIRKE